MTRDQLRIQLVAALHPQLCAPWGLRELVGLVNEDLLPIIDKYVHHVRHEDSLIALPFDEAEKPSLRVVDPGGAS